MGVDFKQSYPQRWVKIIKKGEGCKSQGGAESFIFKRFEEAFVVWSPKLNFFKALLGQSQIFILPMADLISMIILFLLLSKKKKEERIG